jgi:hypothetical protein
VSAVQQTEVAASPALSRRDVERRLLSSGFHCAVRRLSWWEDFALRLLSARAFVAFVLTIAAWLILWSVFNAATTGSPTRFGQFALFDVLAGVAAVFAVVIWRGLRRRDGPDTARGFAAAAIAVVVVLLALPHLLFSVAGLDMALSDLLGALAPGSSGEAAGEDVLPHLGLAVAAAALAAAEAWTGFGQRTVDQARFAFRALPRTLLDVGRTLPVVLAALFLLVFIQELWSIFGQLQFERLVILIGLLILCAVFFIRWIAGQEADAALSESRAGNAPATPADYPEEDQLAGLVELGLEPRLLSNSRKVRKAVVNQWTMQISLRVLFAGILLAGLALLVTALTMTDTVLDPWIQGEPDALIDQEVLGVQVYLTREALSLCALLGAFATVVFIASVLSDDQARDRLLDPERRRMLLLLTIAGTYQAGVKQGLWRGRPGQRWSTYRDFLAEDPDRRQVSPVTFGNHWREREDGSEPRGRWHAAWNPVTGELYAFRWNPPGPTEALAVCHDEARVRERLDGFGAQRENPDSLRWLRERAREMQESAPT